MLIVYECVSACVAVVLRGQTINLPRSGLLPNATPDAVHHFAVSVPFENTVTAQKDKVEFVSEFEFYDLWFADYDLTISAVLVPLGLNIAEGA